MPRRSQRKRVKKNLLDFSEDCKAQCSQTGGEEKKLTNKKVFPSVGKEFCCYCGKEDSPLNKGEEEDTWIDCDICEKWWHGACAKLSDEDIQKFIVHDIKFPCAFCVVGKAGKELKEVSDKLDKVLLNNCSAEVRLSGEDCAVSSHQCEEKCCEEQILVVDSLSSPENFRSSVDINKELSSYPDTQKKTEFAYSLPHGGIALHLKEKVEEESFIKSWPDTAFGGNTKIHPIKAKQNKQSFVAFAKNIPIHLTEELIKESIAVHGCGIVSVHRLRYSNSGKLLPVIKAVFQDRDLYETCLNGIFIPQTKSKYTIFEPERKYRVIRCFNCHRFGHIGKVCIYKSRCINCGGEECSDIHCTAPVCCANCGGSHSASSSKCPTFREISRKRRTYSFVQKRQ